MRNRTSDLCICAPMLCYWATKTLRWAGSLELRNRLFILEYYLVIIYGGGGGEGFKGGSHCFQGEREGGSVVADRVKSGIVENWLPIYYQRAMRGEGFRGGLHCFQGGREGGSVVADRVKSGTGGNWLPIYYQRETRGEGGKGIARILQGLKRGSSKFYRDITDILRNSYISFYPDRLRSLLPPETPEVSLEPGTPAWVLSSLNH